MQICSTMAWHLFRFYNRDNAKCNVILLIVTVYVHVMCTDWSRRRLDRYIGFVRNLWHCSIFNIKAFLPYKCEGWFGFNSGCMWLLNHLWQDPLLTSIYNPCYCTTLELFLRFYVTFEGEKVTVIGHHGGAACPLFIPELGLLSLRSFACSPSVRVGFIWVLQFPPTTKTMPLGGLAALKCPYLWRSV